MGSDQKHLKVTLPEDKKLAVKKEENIHFKLYIK